MTAPVSPGTHASLIHTDDSAAPGTEPPSPSAPSAHTTGIRAPLGVGVLWIVTGLVGFGTAFLLINEVLLAAQGQDLIVQCDVNSVLSCSPNFFAPAGNLLGFPNSLIGVALFPAPVIVGVSTLARTHFPVWYWRIFSATIAAAWMLCLWFQWFSVWGRRSLCPICEVTWLAVIPMFWYTLAWTIKAGIWGRGQRTTSAGSWLYDWAWVLAATNVLVVAVVSQIFLN